MYDVLVIGSGISGMTAAIYCLRAGLNIAIIEKSIYGGQMSITNEIENYPGINKISGFELSQSIYEQVKNLGGKFVFDEIKSVDLKGDIKILKSSKNIYKSKVLIISVGIKRRNLGCKGETEFTGKGISYCATCDGAFFKNKNVIVVGGGNTALEDALYLSNICKKVTMVVRKPHFRGEKALINSVLSKPNIETKMEHIVEEIIGDNSVNSVRLKNTSNQEAYIIPINGIFIAIGYEPDNKIFLDQIELTPQGYFKSDETCKTNLEAVYVAGDCRDKSIRQLVTAASDGVVSANQAISYLNSHN